MRISKRGLLGLIFVFAIIGISLLESRFTRGTRSIYEALYQNDGVEAILAQIECLAGSLPASGRLGYAYGLETDCMSAECGEHYYLTEFAIAPRVAELDLANAEWVIVQAQDREQATLIQEKHNLELMIQCQGDLALYRRRP